MLMNSLPNYIPVTFIVTTLICIYLFYLAAKSSTTAAVILLCWLSLQMFVAQRDFYTVTNTVPPRFLLLIGPPLICIAFLFLTKQGREFIDTMDVSLLTLLHTVRIPVELVLYWLSIQKVVPTLMTFEGRNFDIISGLTAPLIFYFGYYKKVLPKNILWVWNIVCLVLLLNIVINAILSAPFPFQKFAFDQPNIAVLYAPYMALPALVVPLVLLSHLVLMRKLLKT